MTSGLQSRILIIVTKIKEEKEVSLLEFIDVKGWKALGNKLIDAKLVKIEKIASEFQEDDNTIENDSDTIAETEIENDTNEQINSQKIVPELKLPSESNKDANIKDKSIENEKDKPGYKPGDTIEFDF